MNAATKKTENIIKTKTWSADPKAMSVDELQEALKHVRQEAARLSMTIGRPYVEEDVKWHAALEKRFGPAFAQWIIDRS